MDRITRIDLTNVRTYGKASIDLRGLTVLIGDNGVGKSTLIEVCEILRRMPRSEFMNEFHAIHRAPQLFRFGTTEMSIGVRVESELPDKAPLEYRVTFEQTPGGVSVVGEVLAYGAPDGDPPPGKVLERDRTAGWSLDETGGQKAFSGILLNPSRLSIGMPQEMPPANSIARLRFALDRIHVHLPLDPTPAWAASAMQRPLGIRGASPLVPVDRLALGAANLANVYQALKNDFGDDHWRDTMEIVSLGLGADIESVAVRPDAASNVALWLKYRGTDLQVPSFGLSDGMLAWLAFVALDRYPAARSLLAIDEVDLHLHPYLLSRVLDLCTSISRRHPVLITTHSDRLLDMIDAPAEQVVLGEAGPDRATRLLRPDKATLTAWLEKYGGYGRVRAEGYEFTMYRNGR